MVFGALGVYLSASSSETFDDWASELEREGCLGCVGAGDWVARTIWADHGAFVWFWLQGMYAADVYLGVEVCMEFLWRDC